MRILTTFISFARQRNSDSSTDSICTRCYKRIATTANGRDLEVAEQEHRCDPNGEYKLLNQSQSTGIRTHD